jgi:hypothetical protein
MDQGGMEMTARQLKSLLDESGPPQRAPDKIEFAAYPKGGLSVPDGSDHLTWTIGIGKDHTATIYMHKDAWKELQK